MRCRGSFILVTALCWVVATGSVAPAAPAGGTPGAGQACEVDARDQGTFQSTPTADPNVVLTTDTTRGRGRCLGRYRLEASELINLQTGAVTEGQVTIFARGGTLSATYAGQATFTSQTTFAYHVTGPVTGGTGRFAGARGTLTFDGSGDLTTGQMEERITGTLRTARHPRETIVFSFAPLTAGPPTAACPIFDVAPADLIGREGTRIGTGTLCVQTRSTECPDATFVGCVQRLGGTLTVDLPHGTMTFRFTSVQTWLNDFELYEVNSGYLHHRTGIYANHSGRLSGAGVVTFGPGPGQGTNRAVWLVTIRPRT